MSWVTYYVEVSTRQREDEITRRNARRWQWPVVAPRRHHWWSLRRTAPATRAPALGGERGHRRAAALWSAR